MILTLRVRSDKSFVSNQPQVGLSRTDMRLVRDFSASMSPIEPLGGLDLRFYEKEAWENPICSLCRNGCTKSFNTASSRRKSADCGNQNEGTGA